jgi:hypothetical protein
MDIVKIHKQSQPQRCEICHQTDQFDPLANVCQRCKNLDREYLTALFTPQLPANRNLALAPSSQSFHQWRNFLGLILVVLSGGLGIIGTLIGLANGGLKIAATLGFYGLFVGVVFSLFFIIPTILLVTLIELFAKAFNILRKFFSRP